MNSKGFQLGHEYLRQHILDYFASGQPQSGIIWSSGKTPLRPTEVAVTSGGRSGKKAGFEDRELDDGSWIYYGQGPEGIHQNPHAAGNRRLIDRSNVILLFSTREPTQDEVERSGAYRKMYTFKGKFRCDYWDLELQLGGRRAGTRLLRCRLSPITPKSSSDGLLPSLEALADELASDPIAWQMVRTRVRESAKKFRVAAMGEYRAACAISMEKTQEVLDAAHVEAHSLRGINSLANSLLLRTDLHTLFDKGLIKIDPDTRLISIDPSIESPDYRRFHGQRLSEGVTGAPSSEFLRSRTQSVRRPE
jgi:hypothetical protein